MIRHSGRFCEASTPRRSATPSRSLSPAAGSPASRGGTMQLWPQGSHRIVGHARTARIASAFPPIEAAATVRRRRMDYFRHMADAPAPSVAVIEDVDGASATGAWWGEVHARVHAAFGMVGAVTNGIIRDLDEIRPEFPILGGSVGPSHGFVHVRDIGRGCARIRPRHRRGTGRPCRQARGRRHSTRSPSGTASGAANVARHRGHRAEPDARGSHVSGIRSGMVGFRGQPDLTRPRGHVPGEDVALVATPDRRGDRGAGAGEVVHRLAGRAEAPDLGMPEDDPDAVRTQVVRHIACECITQELTEIEPEIRIGRVVACPRRDRGVPPSAPPDRRNVIAIAPHHA